MEKLLALWMTLFLFGQESRNFAEFSAFSGPCLQVLLELPELE